LENYIGYEDIDKREIKKDAKEKKNLKKTKSALRAFL